MNTSRIGWEATLNNNGTNIVSLATNSYTITKIQLSISIKFSPYIWADPTAGYPYGPADVLVFMAVVNSPVSFSGSAQFVATTWPQGQNIGPSYALPVPQSGLLTGGAFDGASGSYILSTILKACSPNAVNKEIFLDNLTVPVASGQNLVFHMDHDGVPCDVEMQGVIYWQ